MERPNGGKAALYLDTGPRRAAGCREPVTPFAFQTQQKPPRVSHRDNWGCLSSQIWVSFLFRVKKRSRELPQQPRLITVYQNPPHTGPPPRAEPRRALPPAAPGSPGYGSASGSAGNRFAVLDLSARAAR